jgi:hypothetical protein
MLWARDLYTQAFTLLPIVVNVLLFIPQTFKKGFFKGDEEALPSILASH